MSADAGTRADARRKAQGGRPCAVGCAEARRKARCGRADPCTQSRVGRMCKVANERSRKALPRVGESTSSGAKIRELIDMMWSAFIIYVYMNLIYTTSTIFLFIS